MAYSLTHHSMSAFMMQALLYRKVTWDWNLNILSIYFFRKHEIMNTNLTLSEYHAKQTI